MRINICCFFLFPSVLTLATKMHLVNKHLHFRNNGLERRIQAPPFFIAFSFTDTLIISPKLRKQSFPALYKIQLLLVKRIFYSYEISHKKRLFKGFAS